MKKNKITGIILTTLIICGIVTILSACDVNNHKHTLLDKYFTDSEYHWHECNQCDEKIDMSKHEFELDVCVVCGFKQGILGLEYSLNDDKNSYTIVSVGSVKADYITIPSFYKDKPVTIIGNSAFEGWTGVSLSVGENVKTIGEKAFQSCRKLTNVTIPEGVTTISSSAFRHCTTLDNIMIPESVENLGKNVFYGCKNLKNITLGNGIANLKEHVFKDCTKLSIIFLPKNITRISSLAFEGCSGLESIQVDSENTKYKSEGNCLLTKNGKILVLGCKNSVIPSSVTDIKAYAFSGCSQLTNIQIPESVINIGSCAFNGCNSLESIFIPISVQNIENSAFYDCKNLTISCEAKSKPVGWDDRWNFSDCQVNWGYNG